MISSDALMTKMKAGLKTGKSAPVEEQDVFEVVSEACENLDKDEAFARVEYLLNGMYFDYFQLGGVLNLIQENEWFREEGYQNFNEFIDDRYGLHYRKARYLIKIYVGLVESGVPWDKVKHLGWTKLKELVDILTVENVDSYAAKADSMTVLQIRQWVANLSKNKSGDGDEDSVVDPEAVSSLTFKVHNDQKETIRQAVDHARKHLGTQFDGVALEAICMNYLSGGTVKPAASTTLREVLSKTDPRKIVEVFNEIYPEMLITLEIPD